MMPSPCTLICTIDTPSGVCLGCGRSLGEIAEWGQASEDRQRVILAGLDERLIALKRNDTPAPAPATPLP